MGAERTGSLRRVIGVGRAIDLPSGGTLFLTSIEIWDDRVVCRSGELRPQNISDFLPPGEPLKEFTPMWKIADDVGTGYRSMGGGSSGSQFFRDSAHEFEPTVPSTAKRLFVLGPGMADSQEISVDLA
jgi:hypothetical protein